MYRLLLTTLALCLLTYFASAQSFKITRLERLGGTVAIHYDLIDSIASRTYTVTIFSSKDNFTSPLEKVTGDTGLEVKPGPGRKVIWDATAELGSTFSGDVSLEVRAKVFIPFIRMDGFDDYRKFKRKKSYNITWSGGRGNNVLNFDLYHGDKKVATYPNIANVGHYKLTFNGVRTGKNYRFKISDSKNKDDVIYTAPFAIRAKIPFLLKALPVVGVGYVIYMLSTRESGNDDIVEPPEPK